LNDELGRATAVGDFNHAGFGDVAMGAPYWDVAAQSYFDVGGVLVVHGAANGMMPMAAGRAHPYHFSGPEKSVDHLGSALAASDFDGDGFGDLAVGEPSYNAQRGRVRRHTGSGLGAAVAAWPYTLGVPAQ